MLFYWDNTEKLPYNTEDSYQWNRHINFPFKLLLHWTISFNVIKPPYNHHKNHALNIWHKFILVYFFTSTSTCLYYIYSVVQRWRLKTIDQRYKFILVYRINLASKFTQLINLDIMHVNIFAPLWWCSKVQHSHILQNHNINFKFKHSMKPL